MTEKEAGRVLATVLLGSAQRERSAEELELLRRYLLPLPFETVMRKVEVHVAQVGRTRDGKATHTWITTPGELLEACGLSDTVAAWVVRAMHDGGQVLPNLRSMDGWSYVPEGATPPVGVLEAQAVARAVPPPAETLALPAPRPNAVADVKARIAEIARAKRMDAERAPRTPPAHQIDAELAMADARFQAEYERAKAIESGEMSYEEAIPYG